MRKKIELVCEQCSCKYKKDLSEHKRNQKLNRKSFCSRSCSCAYGNSIEGRNRYDIRKHQYRGDKYTPYRYIMKLIKRPTRRDNIDIDLEYLKELWEKQKGICPYSGTKMILPTHNSDKLKHSIAASLDRIDSNKPYQRGNVQYIVRAINFMKNNMSHEDTVELLRTISLYHSKNVTD